jgi:hypothetical protein
VKVFDAERMEAMLRPFSVGVNLLYTYNGNTDL